MLCKVTHCAVSLTVISWPNRLWRPLAPCYPCSFIHSFIHLAVCLTIGPKPLPKRALHIVQSRASSFRCDYPLLSLRSSSSFLRLLPRLPVTSIPPFIFSSITCRRRQFLRKMWPIQLAFRLLIPCRIFLCSLTLSNAICEQIKYRKLKKCKIWIPHSSVAEYSLCLKSYAVSLNNSLYFQRQ
jgi:hypothetical protein